MSKYEVRVSHTHVYDIEAEDSEQAVRDVLNGAGKETEGGSIRWTNISTEEIFPLVGGSDEDSK